MSTPALVVVSFGKNALEFRRHWGGDPVITGSEMLDHLSSAESLKPRQHFHTGSWLLRLMFADGDEGGTSLPTYEAYDREDDVYGDWEVAYHFRGGADGVWKIGLIESCFGEPWQEIEQKATWFTPDGFRAFIDEKFAKDQAKGVVYDINIREALFKKLGRR